MKRTALGVAFPALVLLSTAVAQTIQVDKTNRTIAITTTASASAFADIAKINVGFEVFAPDAHTAYQNGVRISNAVMDALKKAGIPKEDIQSANQSLSRTEFPEDDKTSAAERARRQFTLSQSWTVTSSAKGAATVLRLAVQAGATESGNIDWDVSNHDALQAQAAANALIHARAIATQMAAGLGVHLGSLIYASNQAPIQRLIALATSNASLSAQMNGALPPLAILPQKVEESATVYAVFSIE